MTTVTIIFLIIATVAVAFALFMYLLWYRTRRLRDHFGDEYDRTLELESGRTRRAEAELEQRQKRVSRYHVRQLSPEERDRFAAEWHTAQQKFVDDPRGALAMADSVINHALEARNYPVADFEQRSADLSVEYPEVVQDYRIAHGIATADRRSGISTEELRRAMQHYRSLFEELVETNVSNQEEVYR